MARIVLRGVASLLLLALATCDSVDNFTISEKSQTMIEGKSALQTVLGNVGFGQFLDLDITQNATLKNQGVSKDQIDAVHVTRLTLAIQTPAGEDFTFLTSLEFFVTAQGLEKKRIASGGPFPEGTSRIDLMLDDVDLQPYVVAPSMDITTEARGQPPDQDTTIEAEIELDVDVNVGGAVCG
jgi:hypothetical protein